jgi:hypothetical protein
MARTILALVLLSASLCLSAQAGEPEEGRKLFDGKTLKGWEGDENSFRVEDGAIVAGSLKGDVPRNEFLCTTQEFADFELKLKCKLVGKGANAGVQFRTKRIPNHHEVSGYQADMREGWWGKLYDESRRNRVLAGEDTAVQEKLAKALKPDDWNDYVIRCEGPRIQLWLNGVQTVDYTEEEKDIAAKGVIAVQIHGGPPSEAWYKDIVIRELKADDAKDGDDRKDNKEER